MDSLLGNYASDDELAEVNKNTLEVSHNKNESQQKETQPKSISQQPIPGQKKRKLLDISILPEHIQKALIHGDSALGDSDDDDDRTKTSERNHGASSKNSSTNKSKSSQRDAAVDPLLAMLPAPSQNKEDSMDALFSSKSKPSNSTKERDGFVSKKEIHDIKNLETEELMVENIHAEEFQRPPLMTRQYTSEPDTRDFEFPTPSTGHYNQYDYQPLTSDAQSVNEDSNQATYGESQRKRQRNLEQMLMNGNLSVLEQAAVVQDIQVGNQQWDALGYSEQKQKEAAIYKQYTSDGALKSAIQPTRQQNRKHQLTSLAMKAAETEIAMLDAHIARSKTKSQTQSRYGW